MLRLQRSLILRKPLYCASSTLTLLVFCPRLLLSIGIALACTTGICAQSGSDHTDRTWRLNGPDYLFVILNHSRRQVVHFAVTTHPTMAWVI